MNNVEDLRKKCYEKVEEILDKHKKLNKFLLYQALSIRLNISYKDCFFNKFDEKMLNNTLNELNNIYYTHIY